MEADSVHEGRPVEILLVEDNPGDVELTRQGLMDGKILNRLHVVGNGNDAMAYLRQEGVYSQAVRPDLILGGPGDDLISTLPPQPTRLPLTVDRYGQMSIEAQAEEVMQRSRETWRVGWAKQPIASSNRFLFHKTTARELYSAASRDHPECDDVLLWNEKGEVTESCRANLVLRNRDQLITPPLTSGLLPGTLRAELLQRNRIHERAISAPEVLAADEIFLINSVRGWIRVLPGPLTDPPGAWAET